MQPSISMRQIQLNPSMILCNLPLFETNLNGLVRLISRLESMSPDDIETIGRISSNSGARAFYDQKVIDFLQDSNDGTPEDPDVKVIRAEKGVEFVYDSEMDFDKSVQDGNGSDSFIRNARNLLREVKWVAGKTREIYDFVLSHQKAYLENGEVSSLNPLTQSELATNVGLSGGTVSRLLKNKSVRGLDGYITPLASLCLNTEGISRLRALEVIGKSYASGTLPDSDWKVARMVEQATEGEVRIARRTANKYRLFVKDRAERM